MEDKVRAFISYLRAEKGFSHNTISAYQNDLNQLLQFLAQGSAIASEQGQHLTRDEVLQFVLHLRDREYAPTTVARKVAAVKSFCHFLEQEGFQAEDPTQDIDSPRVTKYL